MGLLSVICEDLRSILSLVITIQPAPKNRGHSLQISYIMFAFLVFVPCLGFTEKRRVDAESEQQHVHHGCRGAVAGTEHTVCAAAAAATAELLRKTGRCQSFNEDWSRMTWSQLCRD